MKFLPLLTCTIGYSPSKIYSHSWPKLQSAPDCDVLLALHILKHDSVTFFGQLHILLKGHSRPLVAWPLTNKKWL